MSTKCTINVWEKYPASQVQAEIAWLDREMDNVREQMKRRTSKRRHLADLQRQRDQRTEILDRANTEGETHRPSAPHSH